MPKCIITNFEITPFQVPLIHPLHQSNGTIHELNLLSLSLHSNIGIIGESFIYGIGKVGSSILMPYLKNELLPQVIGTEFTSPHELWKSLWLPRRDKLKGGLCLYALSLIDIACWDITAKQNQKSLHRLLGGEHRTVPVYGSGGWLSMSLKDLYDECLGFVDKGISTFKIKVGSQNDEERISFLRHEFGDKIQFAVDANQRLKSNKAIALAGILQKYDICWFEDPLYSDSIIDLRDLSNKINVPICIGENFHSEFQFKDVCELESAEILQPDVVRCGGITSFLEIIRTAEFYKKKLITHLMPELSISLLGLCNTGFACELIDLFPEDIFTRQFTVKNGAIEIPTENGTGVYLNQDFLRRFKK